MFGCQEAIPLHDIAKKAACKDKLKTVKLSCYIVESLAINEKFNESKYIVQVANSLYRVMKVKY